LNYKIVSKSVVHTPPSPSSNKPFVSFFRFNINCSFCNNISIL